MNLNNNSHINLIPKLLYNDNTILGVERILKPILTPRLEILNHILVSNYFRV